MSFYLQRNACSLILFDGPLLLTFLLHCEGLAACVAHGYLAAWHLKQSESFAGFTGLCPEKAIPSILFALPLSVL